MLQGGGGVCRKIGGGGFVVAIPVSRTFAHLLIQQMIPQARNSGNTFSFIYLFGTRFLNASCLLGPEDIIVNRNQTLSLPSWSSQSSVNLVINDNKKITNI